MSFFSGNKPKDLLSKKANFYVEFLGWMETRGVRGERYTASVVAMLTRRQRKADQLPRLTVQVSKKDIRITQDVEEKKKRNIKKIKFPAIPARDVTFVLQSVRLDGHMDDTVAIIYLGYMPRTQRYVHAHVYRFDEPATAATFVELVKQLTDANTGRIQDVERDLFEKGEIEDPRPHGAMLNSSDGMSDPHPSMDSPVDSAASNSSFSDESPHFGSDDIDPDLQSLSDVKPFDSVTDELHFRLKIGDTPLLLPPKDYDTVHRQHGDVGAAKGRRCLNMDIIGGATRERKGSGESGIDMNSPNSENGGKSVKQSSADINNGHLQADTREEFSYPVPSPTSPLNNRRSGSYRDLDSQRSPPWDYNDMGPGSPLLRRANVYERQHSASSHDSARTRPHEGLSKSSSYNNYDPGARGVNYTGDSGPNSPRNVMHGRQTSQSSVYSNHSYKSDGSRGSNEREEVIYPPVTDTPPIDYDRTLGPVAMRRKVLQPNPEYMTREDLGRSFPQEALRREFLSASGRSQDEFDLRRSQNLGDVQYREVPDIRQPNNGVKRVQSLYR